MNYNDKRKRARNNLSRHKQAEYEKLMRFLRNRYSYEFVDDEQRKQYENKIPFRYLEKMVAINGRAAVYESDKFGIAVYKTVMAGNLNIYGLPGTYFLYTSNGQKVTQVQADDPKLLVLQDNFDGSSLNALAVRYGDMLGKIRETIFTNVHSMRTPFLVTAPKDRLLEVRMALEAVNELPEVITDPGLEFEKVLNVIEMKTPDNLKSLEDEYNTTFGKFMEECGFSSNSIDKKERLVAAEAEDDEGMLKSFDNEAFENRKRFVQLMDDKFGIKLKLIKSNEDLYIQQKPAAPTPKPQPKEVK